MNNRSSCTLNDLSRLSKLRKLNIYTSVRNFSRACDHNDLQKLEGLQKLTICWVGNLANLVGETSLFTTGGYFNLTFPSRLQKLNLQGVPWTTPPCWLSPDVLKKLKKLYIRGGQLRDIHEFVQFHGKSHWTVEILRLKYLSELKIDWRELQILYPKLIYLHQVECPKLTNFPCDESGVWMAMEAIETQVQRWNRLKFYLELRSNLNSGLL